MLDLAADAVDPSAGGVGPAAEAADHAVDPLAGSVGTAAEAVDQAVDLRHRKHRRQNFCRELSNSHPPAPTHVARDGSAVYEMDGIASWRVQNGSPEFLVK